MVHLTNAVAVISFLSSSLFVADGHQKYVARLPNGANVPGVQALGHVNVEGGGARNEFGEDFEDMGEAWTAELCEADSDGDGQTNGQELGDPCCEWNAETASTPRWTTGVSHPGNATSKSNSTLWANVKCSNTTTTNATVGSTDDDSDTSTSGSASGSSSTSSSTLITCSALSGMIIMLLALVV
ncbi:ABC transporter [Phytophthora megakarya]|uniref:ABC transporter n=1 Tax=Phytophthora megakarya TaxID=4795 RepID=A0A225WQK2_9STRA|nr:ABC transporter [Phytophthora megakarya]